MRDQDRRVAAIKWLVILLTITVFMMTISIILQIVAIGMRLR